MQNINPTTTNAWSKLSDHFNRMKSVHMRELFSNDPNRFDKFQISFESMLVDFSKNRLNQETMDNLISLANECKLAEAIQSMFAGEAINQTEDRSVLHVALRNRSNTPVMVDGQDVMSDVNKVLLQMEQFSNNLINGNWKGYTGKPITDLVNIGIGGSDLGPLMVTEALRPYHSHIRPHFVSNVDGTHLAEVLKSVNP